MIAEAAHSTALIATVAASLTAALILGALCRRMGLSPIVGYMLAGIAVGPHTPGFVADAGLAAQLAEIGIALLMFGVGLHFSLRDLLAVRRIAITGALGQSAIATGLVLLLAIPLGWTAEAGLVFGLALSVASTVVLIRGLSDQGSLHTVHGRIAVGWLVVEDLLTVLMLLLLPVLAAAGESGVFESLLTQAGRLAGLILVYPLAVRIVPWCLLQVSRLRSRELFTLTVLVLALGVAYGSAELFGISMALGAFLGGMVVGQSDLSHQAAADALPFRDAFAVLFFVSVGMLFEIEFLIEHPGVCLLTLGVVLLVKPLAAFGISVAMGYAPRTGLTVAAGLAQIGEFSFIVAAQGSALGLLPHDAGQAIVVAALASIALNPLLFRLIEPLESLLRRLPRFRRWLADQPGDLALPGLPEGGLSGHVILCGCGRVGGVLAKVVRARGWPLIVVEQDRGIVQRLRSENVTAIQGDAANEATLERASPGTARLLLVTMPDPLAARQIVDLARKSFPALPVIVRAHAEAERVHLQKQGEVAAVVGEQELAVEMARLTLRSFGVSSIESQAVALDLRRGDFRARADTRVLELTLSRDSRLVGRRIADAGLGKGVIVMAIESAGALRVPDGDTVLAAGDQLLIVTGPENVAQVRELA